MTDDRSERAFSFGQNWREFLDHHFDEERLEIAKTHLLRFLGVPDLAGKTFLDVGCGSGLSSLSAFDAGAERVVSFDLDPESVATTRSLREMRGDPERWQVLEGSVLDREFLSTLEPADVVYSWGVLHHTGALWQALENAAGLVKPTGTLYVGIYKPRPNSHEWLEVKRSYNQASELGKRVWEARYVLNYLVLRSVRRLENPLRVARDHKRLRGMSWFVDARDWLGGYPYEWARVEEVLRYCRKLGFELVDLAPEEECVEYRFQPRGLPLQGA